MIPNTNECPPTEELKKVCSEEVEYNHVVELEKLRQRADQQDKDMEVLVQIVDKLMNELRQLRVGFTYAVTAGKA